MEFFVLKASCYKYKMNLTLMSHYNQFVPHFLVYSINPFIYAAKYGEFQNGVRRMIARVTGKPHQIASHQIHPEGQVT